MKMLFMLITLFLVLNHTLIAQTRASSKADSIQKKSGVHPKADTGLFKFPLTIQRDKFDRIDNADVNLSIDIPIKKFGSVEIADLKLKSCDFEKDANAMVLFDRAEIIYGYPEILMEHQKRIKVFNENGKSEGNIKIELNNRFGTEEVLGVEAITANLINDKIEYTKLDPKLVYFEHINETKNEVVFSMPNVKSGSVIEYRYIWARRFSPNFPKWNFQGDLPTRYSQLDVAIDPSMLFTALFIKDKPFAVDTVNNFGPVWAMANIPSLKEEPFMRSVFDATQSITLVISAKNFFGQPTGMAQSWEAFGKQITDDKGFWKPYDQSLPDESDLVKPAKALKTEDEKVAFLFNNVKTSMKWNDDKNWGSKDGIKNAWKKKSGNWGEINMVLCHLLNQSGIKAYPMLVSTRDNGKIMSNFVNPYQINKLVTYVPVNDSKYYVLDASDKYNIFNEIPDDLLNSDGLYLDKEDEKYELVGMKKDAPVKKIVSINADIKPDGTMTGVARISSFSYNKSGFLELYKKLDEKKYKEYLTDNDNNLKISSLKLENMEADSLPLIQTIQFTLDLPGTDNKYIYFNPNLFTSLYNNPFVNGTRVSDIDFGYNRAFSIEGRYKIPAGYKVEALPKTIDFQMADKSIVFKRNLIEEDGYVMVNYVINYEKSYYPQADYPNIHSYFKRMHEMLDEQIVLRKFK